MHTPCIASLPPRHIRIGTGCNDRQTCHCADSTAVIVNEFLSPDIAIRAPKVLLHDHLDGGLRTETVIELAEEFGYEGLPTHDPSDLCNVVQPWCKAERPGAVSGDLCAHRWRYATP